MSFRQAFHTSCRHGLSGHPGFQFNAASAGLDPEQLSRIAADHCGYRPPPDAPAEPDAAAIARLPVALRYQPVEGVGPVISRTAYVGREFRGADGEPDSGRFGNYFSHVVVGEGEEDPFAGLLPIELWQAPHWSTSESADTELPPLDRLEPGPADLDRVLERLAARGPLALAAVADAALGAVLGGPRAVVIEPEPELAAAWVGWASFALPPDRTGALTFATFDGRPRVAESLRICVTTPACDVDFASYELESAVVLVDAAAPPGRGDLALYGRVLALLAAAGGEAVAAAVRDLPAGLEPLQAGAELAVAAGRVEPVEPGEVAATVAALRRRLSVTKAGALAALAAALPADDGSEAAFAEWSRLYAAARQGDAGATELVDAALERVLPRLAEPPTALPHIDPAGGTPPSAGALAKWLAVVDEAAAVGRLGAPLAAGTQLGLVGCNTALDRELAGKIAEGFADTAVEAAYREIAASGNDRLVEAVSLRLAAAAGAGRGAELLRRAAAQPAAAAAVRRAAEQGEDFESLAAWEILRGAAEPHKRGDAVARLAARAQSAEHEAAIRALYGDSGPRDPGEHAELLGGWRSAGAEAPRRDYEAALEALAEVPFERWKGVAELLRLLGEGPRDVRGDADVAAWGLLFGAAPERRPFEQWAEAAVRLSRRRDIGLSAFREEELRALAARVAAASLEERDQRRGVEILKRGFGRAWLEQLGDALARRAAKSLEPARQIAHAFTAWQGSGRGSDQLLELALPRATGDLSARQLEAVGEQLREPLRLPWQEWLEQHPPRRAVSRAVRGVFRRGGQR